MKIAHIVNLLTPREGSDLVLAQQVTLESLRRAKQAAANIDVNLLSAQYAEDRSEVPEWFTPTENLRNSSLDHEQFLDKRKLPSLEEIWMRLLSNSEGADYIIYSNVDIAVKPKFYSRVAELMSEGWEAISITRRTLSSDYSKVEEIDEMFLDEGLPHPGDDCFVIRRDCAGRLKISDAFIGVAWFDKILLINLAWRTLFKKYYDEHITFHIGDDRTWLNPKAKTVADWNKSLLRNLIVDLEQNYGKAYRNPNVWPHVKTVYGHTGLKVSPLFQASAYLRKIKRYLTTAIHRLANQK
jgi:hypothetical protein